MLANKLTMQYNLAVYKFTFLEILNTSNISIFNVTDIYSCVYNSSCSYKIYDLISVLNYLD